MWISCVRSGKDLDQSAFLRTRPRALWVLSGKRHCRIQDGKLRSRRERARLRRTSESKHEVSSGDEDEGERLWDSLAPEDHSPTPQPEKRHKQQRRLRASNQSCLPANNRETPTALPFLSSPSSLLMLCCGAGVLEAWPPGEHSSCSSSATASGLCPVTGVGRNFPENSTAWQNKRGYWPSVITLLFPTAGVPFWSVVAHNNPFNAVLTPCGQCCTSAKNTEVQTLYFASIGLLF